MKHLFRLIFALLVFIAIPFSSDATDETSLEYKVKAVVLFNFAKYVKWPDKVFSSPSDPIRVCVFGSNPFGEFFDSSDAPKQAQDRDLLVVKLPESAEEKDLAACQVFFWQERHESAVSKFETVLEQHSVLTVADQKTDKSVISFSVVDGKVRFSIRLKAAEALGINISSQLLKLAIVEDRE